MRIDVVPFAPGQAQGSVTRDPVTATAESVVVLHPEEIYRLVERPAAVLVIDGAPYSHPIIRLLGLGAPVAIITAAQAAELRADTLVWVDGRRGLVLDTAPAEAEAPTSGMPVMGPLQSTDGQLVALRASVASAAKAAQAARVGASAIGLVRTEYLVPSDGGMPDAAFYLETLQALLAAAGLLPVTVRLPDLVGDKRPAWLPKVPGMQGALGLQGSRLYDREPVRGIYHAMLQALDALADRQDLRVLVPYLVSAEEFVHWRDDIRGRLRRPLTLGAMVETPAAALAIGELLAQGDFVAVGCNDLMQCLFAADRDIAEVSYLLDPYAPLLYRLLRQMAVQAGARLGDVQLCGLLPQIDGVLPLLLGLGYRAFSVEPTLIPALATSVRRTDILASAALADAVCAAPDADSVRRLVGARSGPGWCIVG
jgi:phosphoenolpyruvate-protein kinase (PTS system EI component)